MRGQTSIEIVLIVSLAIIVSFFVLVKYFEEQDRVFIEAAARQELAAGLDRFDKKFDFNSLASIFCPEEVKVNFILRPEPGVQEKNEINMGVESAIRRVVNLEGRVLVFGYNEPEILTCTK